MSTTEGADKDATPRTERATVDDFGTIAGQRRFLDTFLPVRDQVISEFYRTRTDRPSGPGMRRKLRAVTRILGGGADETIADMYRLHLNHVFSTIWLALDWGPYSAEIRHITDPRLRLFLSQVNSVDTCWRPAVRTAPDDGQFVEIGTGLSDGWARIALQMPRVRILSITLERDQAEIGRRIADQLGLADRVRFRVGDILDPATTRDLIGHADAVTAMGTLVHLPPQRKAEGLAAMAAMLKPGAPLLIFDAYRVRPFSRFLGSTLNSTQCWYPVREDLRAAFHDADLTLVRFDTHTAAECLPIAHDTRSTDRLRKEFGPFIAWLFPKIVGKYMKGLLAPMESVYVVGVRP